ncbi:murein L,D-transpeptidase catalytic domain family protein [Sphingomonas sp. IC-56]|uniref:murein L,D-transpeptidase catalytic domain family protein n=1 Tax=Sphingomonas sp. IC-56 TaxID=2898529 RepID=UPI001E4A8B4D|nr:murein L,D-transpeptidase catalytic domain family protein [Sphingomonas sp. IC-56]
MAEILEVAQSRRALLRSAVCAAGGLAVSSCVGPAAKLAEAPRPIPIPVAPVPVQVAKAGPAAPANIRPELFKRAIAALDRHASRIPTHDRVAIVDFAQPSHRPRLHLVNLGTGACESFLVSHGVGSDPGHTGLLQRFSNEPNSEASSEGAFLTADYYVGKHGDSQRLLGLDPTNNNAYDRAIVVHSAWYSNAEMIAQHGKLGRSQGCFAVGERELAKVFERLGPGRMIYSAKA